MMNELESMAAPAEPEEENSQGEHAPMSPFCEAPTAEEEKKAAEDKRKKEFLAAVNQVSSSETDENSASGSDAGSMKGHRRRKAAATTAAPTKLEPVKEKKKSNVRYFKGMQVMSDTETYEKPAKYDMSDRESDQEKPA